MEFWSKGLGKKTIAMQLSGGESLVSEEALCLKGTMEEPVSWEYVMLIDESDLVDFVAILQEPNLAKYIHASPNRWHLYTGLVMGAVQVAIRVFGAFWKRRFGSEPLEEKVVIELPPPSMLKKKRKKALYRRRLTTTTLAAPAASPPPSTVEIERA
ncbi:MAG: hypothetical protein GY723_19370 [bacterium]|nr:hypothetical protein [bacterium]MCP5066608.1 hypothetical protein [bacterium]